MKSVRIYEVSPRDGLQNESEVIPTDAKLRLIDDLVRSGLTDIEVTSFVRPSWIPQLADAADVVKALPKRDGVTYWSLVPNMRGLERCLDLGMDAVATFMSASETHNKKNLNRTRLESLRHLEDVIGVARDEGLRVRSYISTVFGCAYEGNVDVSQTTRIAHALLQAGADEIALGDTTGMGNPEQVKQIIDALVSSGVQTDQLALHLHDTRGTALANAYAGWQAGIRTFDGSVAGLGGCPYAPGASGNAATEDLVYMFEAMGVSSGVDLDALTDAGLALGKILGRDLPGRFHRFSAAGRERTSKTA